MKKIIGIIVISILLVGCSRSNKIEIDKEKSVTKLDETLEEIRDPKNVAKENTLEEDLIHYRKFVEGFSVDKKGDSLVFLPTGNNAKQIANYLEEPNKYSNRDNWSKHSLGYVMEITRGIKHKAKIIDPLNEDKVIFECQTNKILFNIADEIESDVDTKYLQALEVAETLLNDRNGYSEYTLTNELKSSKIGFTDESIEYAIGEINKKADYLEQTRIRLQNAGIFPDFTNLEDESVKERINDLIKFERFNEKYIDEILYSKENKY